MQFDHGCDGKPTLNSSNSGSEVSRIHSFKTEDLATVKGTDFPDANELPSHRCGLPAEIGSTYLIEAYTYDTPGLRIRGAIKVLDMDKDGRWVRLEFRRISIDPVTDWVKYQPVPLDNRKVELEFDLEAGGAAARYSPVTRTRADVKSYYHENIDFELREDGVWLRVDSRPFAGRGFREVDAKFFDNPQAFHIPRLMNKSVAYNRPARVGGVYVADLRNYFGHLRLILRVESISDRKVKISVRDIYGARAPFNTEWR